ncbi:MAG: hypothetical protein EBS83_10140 [Planctomycetia bacterium]|nr:hypothetical protein [Planctomycetia bacterium]NDH92980.1 hypothetical protein [Planctomycetia bacterium]
MFLEEIEQLLCHAADVPTESNTAGQARPRLGAVSFQHRFVSALNQHVHLHACVTNGVYARTTRCGRPSRRLPSEILASSGTRRRASMPVPWLTQVETAAVRRQPLMQSLATTTRHGLPERSC